MSSLPETSESDLTMEHSDEILAELIWNDQYVEDETHLEELRGIFLEKLLQGEEAQNQSEVDGQHPQCHGKDGDSSESGAIEKKIQRCANHLERIQIVKEYFQWIPFSSSGYTLFQKLEKNVNLSTLFRERGNSEYKKQRLFSALRAYNLAISFGRPGQEECGLAYANRSALLLHIIEPQLALRDIELAFMSQFPENLRVKLEERKQKCQSLIEHHEQMTGKENENPESNSSKTANTERTPNNSQSEMDKQNGSSNRKRNSEDNITQSSLLPSKVNNPDSNKKYLTEKEYSDREFFTLRQPNQSIIGAENFLNIETNQERGRRLEVNQDVEAGSLLLIEKPFATLLEKEVRWDVEHCQLCLKRILSGIPCEQCSFAMYCTEACREKAKLFHQYEHHLWIYLHGIKSSRRDLVAARIISILGPEGILKLYKAKEKNQNQSPKQVVIPIDGFNENGIYDPSTYDPIHHLTSHTAAESLYDIVSNSFKAIIITNILHEKTQFLTTMHNLFETSTGAETENSSIMDKLFDFTASLILHHLQNIPYNAISLNEIRFRRTNNSDVLACSHKEIQENSIKSVSYAVAIFGLLAMCNHSCDPNAVHVRQIEQERTALVTLRSLKKGEEVCITYGPLFTMDEKSERQSVLKEKYRFDCDCTACVGNWNSTADFTVGTLKVDEIAKYENELRQAHKLIIEENQYIEGMEKVRPCLQYFGANFPPTFSLAQVAQDLFKKALVNIVNKKDSNHNLNFYM